MTHEWLRKIGVPAGWLGAISLALVLGGGVVLKKLGNDIHQVNKIFPKKVLVTGVADGDTIYTDKVLSVRLIGVNAPERGGIGYQEAKDKLEKMING